MEPQHNIISAFLERNVNSIINCKVPYILHSTGHQPTLVYMSHHLTQILTCVSTKLLAHKRFALRYAVAMPYA